LEWWSIGVMQGQIRGRARDSHSHSLAPCTAFPFSVSFLRSLRSFAAIPVSDLQPFGVEYAGFVRAFVSMRAEIIALSL
jgi:hypothetical protein